MLFMKLFSIPHFYRFIRSFTACNNAFQRVSAWLRLIAALQKPHGFDILYTPKKNCIFRRFAFAHCLFSRCISSGAKALPDNAFSMPLGEEERTIWVGK